MSLKIEEFKSFARENPQLITYVKDGKMTWQSFYEIYDIYGKESEVWKEYLEKKENKEESTSKSKKTGSTSFSDIVNLAKNMDVDKVQEGINSLQKAISLFSDLFIKSDTDVGKNNYTPRPIYRSFED